MERFTSAIRRAVESKNWFGALYLALTMPDICGALEAPRARNGDRYRSWFDRYLAPVNRTVMRGQEVVFMTSGDCWALRCSMLHEGSDEVDAQQAKDVLRRFYFTTLGSHRIRVEDTLTLDVSSFCEEIAQGVEKWASDVATNSAIQERIAAMVQVREVGFSPWPGIQIG